MDCKIILIIATSLMAILAGCLGGGQADSVTVEVKSAAVGGGKCNAHQQEMSDSEKCHRFVVTVGNQNEEEELEIDQAWWSAQDESGGVYDAIAAYGPDRIIGGGSAEVVVLLAAGSGSIFTDIHYKYTWMNQPVTADIPLYPAPKIGLSTASGSGADSWNIRVTSATQSAPLTEYSVILTTPQGTSSTQWTGDPLAIEASGGHCYQITVVTGGSNLALGARIQLGYKAAADCNTASNFNDALGSGTYELELHHRPTESSAGSLSRDF